MITNDISEIRKLPLFRNLNETECRQIIEIIKPASFKTGDVLIKQNETSRNLWVLLSGVCEVTKRIEIDKPDSKVVTLALLEPPSHFGEMSFFNPAPHSADVRARTDVHLVKISHGDYQDMIDEGVWAAYKVAFNVIQGLADRMRRMDDWVIELLHTDHPEISSIPEWSNFRDKMLNRWKSD